MTTKKITENGNTKREIFEAYQSVLAQLNQTDNQKLDPAKEQANKIIDHTLSEATKTASINVEDQITALQKNVFNILGELSNNFSEKIKNFNTLQEAIALKERELKELVDIEKEAFTLAALVNTRKELANKYDTEQNDRQLESQARLSELNEQMRQLRITTNAEIDKLKSDAEKERQRAEEEYNYNFKRKQQQDSDALADQLSIKRKNAAAEIESRLAALALEKKTIDDRENAIKTREEKMSDLETKIAQFPEIENKIREEVEEKVRKEEAKTAAIKENYAKKQLENERALFETELKLLKESLASEKAKNNELTTKLDEAYGKIQNMALASVNGSQESKAFERMAGMLNEKGNK
ncbi:hypothetical protein D3C87_79120 [compost metagenome]